VAIKISGSANILIGFLLGVVLTGIAVAGFFAWDYYKRHAHAAVPAPASDQRP
jgi:hypothetical protein